QAATASTGDGVAGQVLGSVSAGRTSIDARNRSSNSDVTTGDANAADHISGFAGQNSCGGDTGTIAADIIDANGGCNIQEGDNRATNNQTSNASTGDGVAGQVIGAVSAGATSIDARNRSASTDVTTGDATATDALSAFVGLESCTGGTLSISDIS